MENEQDEVIVDDVEETNEEATEEVVEEAPKVEKPKRTPQEEYEYHTGKAKRLAKKLGLNEEKPVERSSNTPSELTDGQIAILRTEGIKSKAEIALFKEIMSETGKGVLDLLDSSYLKSRLSEFRDTQESMNAIPKSKNRSGQTGVTDTDLAVAKFKETGQLPSDFKTRAAVVKVLEAEEAGTGMFEGPSVIGPR